MFAGIWTTPKHIVMLNVTGLKASTEAGFTRHRSRDPVQFSASQVAQFRSGTWTCLQGKKKRMKSQIARLRPPSHLEIKWIWIGYLPVQIIHQMWHFNDIITSANQYICGANDLTGSLLYPPPWSVNTILCNPKNDSVLIIVHCKMLVTCIVQCW